MASLPEYLHETKGPTVVVVITLMPSLALVVVLARLWTRGRIVQNLALDDWFAGLGMIMAIATSIAMGYQVKNGMGRHIMELTPQQGIDSLKALFASIITYNFGLTFAKLSILLQYCRICASKALMRIIYLLMAVVVIYSAWCFFSGVFNCVPVAKFWDDTIHGHCINKGFLWFFNAAWNIAIDFSLVAVPFFLLKGLMLPKRQKYTLIAILGLGGFASVMSILRLWALYLVYISHDITWDNPGTAIWSNIELNTALICASLPALRPLVSRYLPSLLPSRVTGSHPQNYGSSGGTGSHSHGIAKRFSKLSSMGRKHPTSSGFDTLSEDEAFYSNGKGDLESAGEDSPVSVRMMPLPLHGAQQTHNAVGEHMQFEFDPHHQRSVEGTGFPAYTAHSRTLSGGGGSGMSDREAAATPPADGIRVVTSMRQTIEDRAPSSATSPVQPVGMGVGGRWGSAADRDGDRRRDMMLGIGR